MNLEIASDKDKCQTAIDGLVKGIEGTSLKKDFNTLATDPNLIDEVVENLEEIYPNLRKIRLNENGNCWSIGVIISALKLEILGQTNIQLYDLPEKCLQTQEDDVQAGSPSSSINLGKVALSMSKDFVDKGTIIETALKVEIDAINTKKVNIILNNTNVFVFDFESSEKANKMLDWVGINKSGESTPYKYESGREYGWLSASEEAKSPCDIGYDESGGCSYGKHQMAVKTGKLNEFIDWLAKNYSDKSKNEYKGFTEAIINDAKSINSKKGCATCELTIEFQKVCDNMSFIGLAHEFISEKNYKPTYNKIMNMFGELNLFKNLDSKDEEALKEMCYSLGVQHGGAFRIFMMALFKDYTECSEIQILDIKDYDCSPSLSDFPNVNPSETQKTTMKQTANSISMQEYVKRVYAARKLYVKANRNTIKDWENIIRIRYKKEENSIEKTIYNK